MLKGFWVNFKIHRYVDIYVEAVNKEEAIAKAIEKAPQDPSDWGFEAVLKEEWSANEGEEIYE